MLSGDSHRFMAFILMWTCFIVSESMELMGAPRSATVVVDVAGMACILSQWINPPWFDHWDE